MEPPRLLRAPLVPALLFVALLAGCLHTDPEDGRDTDFPPPPDGTLAALYTGLATAPEVRFETDHGTIRLLLYSAMMPVTTGRFAELTEDGFYDSTLIHRVVDDFVIQGGDPSGTGWLGSGQTIPFERHPDLLFGAGAMGLARDVDPDSGDSQWFITEKPAPHLSDPATSATGDVFGAFALFGQVFDGMDVVRSIAAVPVLPGADRPIQDVHLDKALLLPPPMDIDLLHRPPTIRVESGLELQRPLHIFSGHPFPLELFLASDQPAPPAVSVTYRPADAGDASADLVVRLQPHPDDPHLYQGTAVLPQAGPWTETLDIGEATRSTVTVLPWHDEYRRFTGTDPSTP